MESLLPFPQIIRGRPNKENEMFCQESDISYISNKEDFDKISLGRFNRKRESMFYGAIPTENKETDYIKTSMLECCKELSSFTVERQLITVGGWLVKEKFHVINLCFDEKHYKDNPNFKEHLDEYLNKLDECYSFEMAHFVKHFLKFFSALSSTKLGDNTSYFITTALFVAIKDYYEKVKKEKIWGLIYPSAITDAKGLNIVLTPDAVKSFLQLYHVTQAEFVKMKGNNGYSYRKCSDMVKVIDNEFRLNYKQL
jgi:hypothetical protein